MAKTFVEGIKTPIKGLVSEANGHQYLPWPTAMALAERPPLSVVQFDSGHPYLEFFGGLVVAVEGAVGEHRQRVWLPVLTPSNLALAAERATARDIGDAQSRCRAKAAALIHGVGMSLYAGHGDSVVGFLKELGITPQSDLSQIPAPTGDKRGAAYVDWTSAYTAAKLTDPNFRFEVEMFEDVDPETGEMSCIPARRVRGGWMVAVTLHYKGDSHTEWLPIMGVQEVQTKNGRKKMDHQPLVSPSTHDWNRAVMRCLTRGIAVLTGYGIAVYAREDLDDLHREPMGSQPRMPAETSVSEANEGNDSSSEAAPQVQEPSDEDHAKLLTRIERISNLESAAMARTHLSKQFAGTKALEIYLNAIERREAKLEQLAA